MCKKRIKYGLILATILLSTQILSMRNQEQDFLSKYLSNGTLQPTIKTLSEDLIKETQKALSDGIYSRFGSAPIGDRQCQWLTLRLLETLSGNKCNYSDEELKMFTYSLFIKKYRIQEKGRWTFDKDKFIYDYKTSGSLANRLYKDAQKWLERSNIEYMQQYKEQPSQTPKEPIPSFISYKLILENPLVSRFIIKTRMLSPGEPVIKKLFERDGNSFVLTSAKNVALENQRTPIFIFEGEKEEPLDDHFENISIEEIILANGASYAQYPKCPERRINDDLQLEPVKCQYYDYLSLANEQGMSENNKRLFFLKSVYIGTTAEVFCT